MDSKPAMLLLKYQRQRQLEAEDNRKPSEIDMRRKLNDRDVKGDSHRAATRGTLICIFVCGSLLLALGLALLLSGLLVPELNSNPTPWLVTGPTCIVLGILVLLLSVEIIMKLRKISGGEADCSDDYEADKKTAKSGWGTGSGGAEVAPAKNDAGSKIPVIIEPSTPLELDPSALPLHLPERH